MSGEVGDWRTECGGIGKSLGGELPLWCERPRLGEALCMLYIDFLSRGKEYIVPFVYIDLDWCIYLFVYLTEKKRRV